MLPLLVNAYLHAIQNAECVPNTGVVDAGAQMKPTTVTGHCVSFDSGELTRSQRIRRLGRSAIVAPVSKNFTPNRFEGLFAAVEFVPIAIVITFASAPESDHVTSEPVE